MKSTFFSLLCYVAAASVEQQQLDKQGEKAPSIVEDPLLHLGFAWKDLGVWSEQTAKGVKHGLDKVDLGDRQWLDQAGNDIGAWTDQAGRDIGGWTGQVLKDIKQETDKIDLTVPNQWIRQAAVDIQKSIHGLDNNDFERWLKQASYDIGIDAALNDLKFIKLEDLPAEAWTFIQEHPGQTALYVVEGVVFLAPGLVYGPLLSVLGFGSGGVKAGTAAAFLQRTFGGAVPAGNWFAHLQSAQMSGYGVYTLNGISRASSAILGAIQLAIGQADGVAEREGKKEES